MTQLEFEIDELVLIGFEPHDRHRIADALQQALSEKAMEAGLISAISARVPNCPLLRGADIRLSQAAPAARPADIASAIASSVTGALRSDKIR